MLQKLIKNKLGFSISCSAQEENKGQVHNKDSRKSKRLKTENIESSQKSLKSQRQMNQSEQKYLKREEKSIQSKRKSGYSKIQLPKITKNKQSISNLSNSIKQKLDTNSLRSSRSSSLRSSARRSNKRFRLSINITNTHYPVIQKVAKELNFKIVDSYAIKKWDIKWCDNAITTETLTKMNKNQRINHFPGMSTIARKNQLVLNINKMKLNFSQHYDFTPRTFLIPKDHSKLVIYDKQSRKKGLLKTYIVKPQASCQGRGIYLTQNIQQIPSSQPFVVQKYVINPLLYKGLKFDLRIYALITSCYPLALYVYNEGLVRFATQKYEFPSTYNLQNLCMHLTNYAINKENPNYLFNQSLYNLTHGHKKSLAEFFKELKSMNYPVHKYWSEIKDCITKTVISGVPHLTKQYKVSHPKAQKSKMCFQILGFDFMMDTNGKVYLLQVNHTPALTTDTPLDELIKSSLIKDTLKIIQKNSWSYQITNKENNSESQQNFGSYSLIYPSKNISAQKKYQVMLEYAFSLQQNQSIRDKIQRYIPVSLSKANKIARTYTQTTDKNLLAKKKSKLVQSLQPLNNKFQVLIQFKSKQFRHQKRKLQSLQKRSSRSSSSNSMNIRNSKSSLLINLNKLQQMKLIKKSSQKSHYRSSRSLLNQDVQKHKDESILYDLKDKNKSFSKLKLKGIVKNLIQENYQNQVAYSDNNLYKKQAEQIKNRLLKQKQKIKPQKKQTNFEQQKNDNQEQKISNSNNIEKSQKQIKKAKYQQSVVYKGSKKDQKLQNWHQKLSGNLNMNFNINVKVKLDNSKKSQKQKKSNEKNKDKNKNKNSQTKFKVQVNLSSNRNSNEQINNQKLINKKQQKQIIYNDNQQIKYIQDRQYNLKLRNNQDRQQHNKEIKYHQKRELRLKYDEQQKQTKTKVKNKQSQTQKINKNKKQQIDQPLKQQQHQQQYKSKYLFQQPFLKGSGINSSDQDQYQQVYQSSLRILKQRKKLTINKSKNRGSNNSKLFTSFDG